MASAPLRVFEMDTLSNSRARLLNRSATVVQWKMSGYTYHFRSEEVRAPGGRLTCSRLAQNVVESCARLGTLYQPVLAVPKAEIADEGNALSDVDCWEDVRQLRWSLSSDGQITMAVARTRIADLEQKGNLGRVRASVSRLVGALVAAYPALADESPAQLAHLVAQGRDLAISAAESPDLYEFVKKEQQPVDLVTLLGL